MKTILKWWAGYLALFFTITGCTSKVYVEKDDTADFGRYKTFAWVEKEGSGKQSIQEQKVRLAVTEELERIVGWKESKKRPDVLLSYDVLVERSVRQNSDPVYSRPFMRTFYNPYSRRLFNVYYPSRFMGVDNYDVPVKEGTITVTVTDARSEKAVWQGWTTNEVNNRNLTSKEIQSAVRAIFRKFDVAKR